MQLVNKGLRIRIYPNQDMMQKIEQGIGNARFVWNRLLQMYKETYQLFKDHGYTRLQCNMTTFNTMLGMLKTEYDFLKLSESTSLQQVFRDLNKAFTSFFKGKSAYPKFKSKKNPKQSFRIQKNGNNIRITNRRIRLAKLGFVRYHTSKEYRKLLKSSKNQQHNH